MLFDVLERLEEDADSNPGEEVFAEVEEGIEEERSWEVSSQRLGVLRHTCDKKHLFCFVLWK